MQKIPLNIAGNRIHGRRRHRSNQEIWRSFLSRCQMRNLDVIAGLPEFVAPQTRL